MSVHLSWNVVKMSGRLRLHLLQVFPLLSRVTHTL